MKVAVVVGNPKPQSRTAHIAMSLVEQIFGPVDSELIELSSHADKLFSWPSDEMAALNQRVAESNIAVFASPTYKATYTGLLKAFLDRYPANGLRGVVALPVMTGADASHSLAPTTTLIPLLLELGAVVPTAGLYFNTAQYQKIDALIAERVSEVRGHLDALRPVLDAVGPMPAPSNSGEEHSA
ncbi:MAG: NAD(P)H-dependent oxidoreductase [Rhizobiales bacterium]|nr:NAD(P)H-dependent oxidoreductase [Hyphomicrobiales bacterium]